MSVDLFKKYGVTFNENEIIFCEHEKGDKMYIIMNGEVKISRIGRTHEQVLAILKEGDIFGEMAIVEDKPRSATAVSLTSTRLLAFGKEDFDFIFDREPELAVKLIRILAKRLKDTYDMLKRSIR
ncbi:MAG: cyclic nucleotide-binding domain-containing protein [Candidatus Hydrogenedentota bacterium]